MYARVTQIIFLKIPNNEIKIEELCVAMGLGRTKENKTSICAYKYNATLT